MKLDSKRRKRGMRSSGAQKFLTYPFPINNDLQISVLNLPASAYAIPEEFISQLISLTHQLLRKSSFHLHFPNASHLPLPEKLNKTHFHLLVTSISSQKTLPSFHPPPSTARADTQLYVLSMKILTNSPLLYQWHFQEAQASAYPYGTSDSPSKINPHQKIPPIILISERLAGWLIRATIDARTHQQVRPHPVSPVN